MKYSMSTAIVLIMIFSGCSSKSNKIQKVFTTDCKFNSENSWFDNHNIRWNGGCLNGYLSGEGRISFYNKDTGEIEANYFGKMRNGMMNDTYGVLYPKNENQGNVIYKGGYKNNQKDGYGEYWKPMKNGYEGLLFKVRYKNDKRISDKYVGKKPASTTTSGLSTTESVIGLGLITLLGAKAISKAISSGSSSSSNNSYTNLTIDTESGGALSMGVDKSTVKVIGEYYEEEDSATSSFVSMRNETNFYNLASNKSYKVYSQGINKGKYFSFEGTIYVDTNSNEIQYCKILLIENTIECRNGLF